MSGVEARRSCKGLFEKLDILPMTCQYILSVMLFVTNYQNNFYMCLNVHRLNKGNKNQLYIPTANPSTFQKGVTDSGIRIFNKLPSNNQHLRNDRVHFKNKLCKYLITNSFYSITEFLEHSTN